MTSIRSFRRLASVSIILLPFVLAACVGTPEIEDVIKPMSYGPSQECLARAMYFESNRSSPEGMLAVGTVVMNRVESGRYPTNVCDVVGQPRQFAPGVMTRQMGAGKELAMQTAAEILSGKRHGGVENAKFFHTAGLRFPYNNMNYKVIAGGNAFYEKVSRSRRGDVRMASQAEIRGAGASGAIDRIRQNPTPKTDAKTQVAAVAKTKARTPEDSQFLALWQGLTAESPTPKPADVRAAAAAAPQGKSGRLSSDVELPGVSTELAAGTSVATANDPASDVGGILGQ
ncbi:cell wall hydrolase [Aurantimonas sp. C2-6-R+9]|uniref:cell wall hydrolase n=1 Tax=unclassified Aurantimonas TaxID=2638230 RepID=UPI002E180D6E|nr:MULTISPECIES: cell wall hydrolase [unclassified Aurantimonas]MEC5289685.1 cell wall hydrolase [Aurantimonas sp. C2-3-R2]MEC5379651.1 cell wall hydrolase [Aurantimonas sp. C2-6-R+9]MEC5410878.1 cell wall hydrolase [Aurantimonas sp. C2-4-R8]